MPVLESILKPDRETYPGKYRDSQPDSVFDELFTDFLAIFLN